MNSPEQPVVVAAVLLTLLCALGAAVLTGAATYHGQVLQALPEDATRRELEWATPPTGTISSRGVRDRRAG